MFLRVKNDNHDNIVDLTNMAIGLIQYNTGDDSGKVILESTSTEGKTLTLFQGTVKECEDFIDHLDMALRGKGLVVG